MDRNGGGWMSWGKLVARSSKSGSEDNNRPNQSNSTINRFKESIGRTSQASSDAGQQGHYRKTWNELAAAHHTHHGNCKSDCIDLL
jgi:hypothetical protein